jgi:cytoskeletal protein CcmA (bactofilin family)
MKLKTPGISGDDISILTESIEVTGNVTTKGNLRVDGKVKGDIRAAGNLTIGEGGEVLGNVIADSLTVGGYLNGHANVEHKITIESKAKMNGDLIARILVIEEGAVFVGKSEMNREKGEQQQSPS